MVRAEKIQDNLSRGRQLSLGYVHRDNGVIDIYQISPNQLSLDFYKIPAN